MKLRNRMLSRSELDSFEAEVKNPRLSDEEKILVVRPKESSKIYKFKRQGEHGLSLVETTDKITNEVCSFDSCPRQVAEFLIRKRYAMSVFDGEDVLVASLEIHTECEEM